VRNVGSKSDLERLKKELTEVTNEVSGIWRLQSQANLDEDSLKLASQQLGLLAARKKAIEGQIEAMKEIEADASSVKDQVKFVEGNVKDLMKGWSKTTNTLKKRLLKRAIKRIVVTKDEMKVVFWLSADARDGSNPQPKAAEIDSSADILEFRRRSRLAAHCSNQNLSISGSLIGKIGRGAGT
jgi:hypothetical protein